MNTTTKSLKTRLVEYLQRKGTWMASGELQRLVSERTTYTAQNAGRRLREAVNEGLLEVKYDKGHAQYRFHQGYQPGGSCGCGLCLNW